MTDHDGRTVGDSLSVADLKIYWVVDKLTNGTLDGIPTSLLDGLAAVTAWRKNVAAVREAAWPGFVRTGGRKRDERQCPPIRHGRTDRAHRGRSS